MNEEMEKCVLQNIPWANLPPTVKQVIIYKLLSFMLHYHTLFTNTK